VAGFKCYWPIDLTFIDCASHLTVVWLAMCCSSIPLTPRAGMTYTYKFCSKLSQLQFDVYMYILCTVSKNHTLLTICYLK
jgi:hypothetical protein